MAYDAPAPYGYAEPRFSAGCAASSWASRSVTAERTSRARILEGVAFMARDHLQVLSEVGLVGHTVRSVGGGTRSDLWLQLIANVVNVPIEVPQCREAAALGAAVLAAVGSGYYPSPEHAIAEMCRYESRFEPDPAAAESTPRIIRSIWTSASGCMGSSPNNTSRSDAVPEYALMFADLTSVQVGQAVSDQALVLVPVAQVEEHGPHLPISTDLVIATEVAEAAARACRGRFLSSLRPLSGLVIRWHA